MPILRKLFSVIRKNKARRLTDTSSSSNDDDTTPAPSSPSSSLKPPPMIDSAFCASHISSDAHTEWGEKLERTHQHGEQLSLDWYQSLDQLASMMDKVVS